MPDKSEFPFFAFRYQDFKYAIINEGSLSALPLPSLFSSRGEAQNPEQLQEIMWPELCPQPNKIRTSTIQTGCR